MPAHATWVFSIASRAAVNRRKKRAAQGANRARSLAGPRSRATSARRTTTGRRRSTSSRSCASPPQKPDPDRAEEQDRIRSEAVTGLLKRFTFTIDPSITDQLEKEKAFTATLKAGRLALEPIRVFATKAESLSWPMRIVRALVEEEEFVGELLGMLEPWDTEYARFFDPKLQLLVELESHKDARIREAVEPFLADVNETVRFHAAATHPRAGGRGRRTVALIRALDGEESFRVKNKVVDGVSRPRLGHPRGRTRSRRARTCRRAPPSTATAGC